MTASDPEPGMAVFDVGGTWLRSGRLRGDAVVDVDRRPAPSRLHRPDAEPWALRDELVATLADLTGDAVRAAVSLGAALDSRRQLVYGSGPMWGNSRTPVDLGAQLRRARPDVEWILVNDLTAAVADFAARVLADIRKICYVTVSSGVACRILDRRRQVIPVDEWGLQGEIGHLPLTAGDDGPAGLHRLPCDCGGSGHLASVASGPGVRRVARTLGVDLGEAQIQRWLTDGLDVGDPTASSVLRLAVSPIADTLRTLWCLDPEIDVVGIGGGVAEGVHKHYERYLVEQLCRTHSYADRGRDADWVRERVHVCAPGEIDGMRGAGRVAAGHCVEAR
jgi:predicted NBD/HSP70 family sugar kinase